MDCTLRCLIGQILVEGAQDGREVPGEHPVQMGKVEFLKYPHF